MHSSRMRTARSLTVSPYLVISHACPPLPEQPRMLPREQPRMPPEQPRTPAPRATTHPPEQPCTPPGATTHPPEQPHMPPRATMHAPPGATMHAPHVNRMTNRCKNITLPQTSFAGSKDAILRILKVSLKRFLHTCTQAHGLKSLPLFLKIGCWIFCMTP